AVSAPNPTVLMSSPRYTPSGATARMRVMRGSTTPPNWLPFIRLTTNCVCRYEVMLFLVRPQKLVSSLLVAGYESSASSALLTNDLSTSAITDAGAYVDLL